MRRRGGVFILALVVVAVLTALLVSVAGVQQNHFRQTLNRMDQRRAAQYAEAGVQRAIAELALIENPGQALQTDGWYTLGNLTDDRFLVGDGSFRLEIKDAAALVNLNTADEEQLRNLGLTTEQVDSLLDWREAEETPRAEGGKDEYYSGLVNAYNARKARLESFDELLLVKGFTPATLYSPLEEGQGTPIISDTSLSLYQLAGVDSFSPNLNPDGQNRTNINTAQVQALIQAGLSPQVAAAIITRRGQGFSGMGAVLQTPGLDTSQAGILLDRFSVGGAPRQEGKLNVNTASLDALMSLPGITSDIADGIVGRQSAGITAMSELLQIPGLDVQTLQQSIDRLTVSSDTFLIRVIGEVGQTRVAKEAIVRVSNGTPRILKRLDPPFTDMRTLWNWTEDATNEIELGTASE